jgi:hypothetical protein
VLLVIIILVGLPGRRNDYYAWATVAIMMLLGIILGLIYWR